MSVYFRADHRKRQPTCESRHDEACIDCPISAAPRISFRYPDHHDKDNC
ncbi:hypothetical protein X945_5976 [Burkholderia pseudomallei ABCPW 107]|nr:hypothetical protein X948_5713 [Burkholderia pseudomallei MSHR5608]KGS34723.1 hypothetical protein X945_5976 [Burkholderia pseudomallei ABCPW 107]KGX48990.1 hypothetical protein Y025_5742 [Burkholderia pseudomallei TSV32]